MAFMQTFFFGNIGNYKKKKTFIYKKERSMQA